VTLIVWDIPPPSSIPDSKDRWPTANRAELLAPVPVVLKEATAGKPLPLVPFEVTNGVHPVKLPVAKSPFEIRSAFACGEASIDRPKIAAVRVILKSEVDVLDIGCSFSCDRHG